MLDLFAVSSVASLVSRSHACAVIARTSHDLEGSVFDRVGGNKYSLRRVHCVDLHPFTHLELAGLKMKLLGTVAIFALVVVASIAKPRPSSPRSPSRLGDIWVDCSKLLDICTVLCRLGV